MVSVQYEQPPTMLPSHYSGPHQNSFSLAPFCYTPHQPPPQSQYQELATQYQFPQAIGHTGHGTGAQLSDSMPMPVNSFPQFGNQFPHSSPSAWSSLGSATNTYANSSTALNSRPNFAPQNCTNWTPTNFTTNSSNAQTVLGYSQRLQGCSSSPVTSALSHSPNSVTTCSIRVSTADPNLTIAGPSSLPSSPQSGVISSTHSPSCAPPKPCQPCQTVPSPRESFEWMRRQEFPSTPPEAPTKCPTTTECTPWSNGFPVGTNGVVKLAQDEPPSTYTHGKTRTKDKYRVVYSDRQRLELEKEFHYSRYITINRKAELSKSLDLTERQIKIWFQNRRAKERKLNKKRHQMSGDKDCGSPEKSLSDLDSTPPPPLMPYVPATTVEVASTTNTYMEVGSCEPLVKLELG